MRWWVLLMACACSGLCAEPVPDIASVAPDLHVGIEGDFTFLETGFRNHNDAWALRPSAARRAAREWLKQHIEMRKAGRQERD